MTYGLTGYYERPLEHIDDAFSAIDRPNNSVTPREYLVAIRAALASNVDIAEELGHSQPDAVTRAYLQAVEARLRKEPSCLPRCRPLSSRSLRYSATVTRRQRSRASRPVASGGPGRRINATYHQTLAGALDACGRSAEALVEAQAALAIDREYWPEAHGTWLSMHSLYIILECLGRDEKAAALSEELLALGEKLDASTFACGAAVRAKYLTAPERRVLLERAVSLPLRMERHRHGR